MPQPVLVAGARTPIGKLLGALSSLSAPDLGGIAIRAALAGFRAMPSSCASRQAANSAARCAKCSPWRRPADTLKHN